MRVLIACEFSGVVRRAFRERGHDAWSCDLLPAEDGNEFHICHNILEVMQHREWDLMIAHPPCTYISNMSNCRIREPGRLEQRRTGMEFFLRLANASIPKTAIENPRGLPEREYRKADQIIQPSQFGHPVSKATCLWLKNLPPLIPTNIVNPERKWDGKRWRTWVDGFSSSQAYLRSVTFPGIAKAMAEQWG
jgi:hypothetical protein